tara:strand:- start:449 stop:577 length:129 start_codon:yes stop_codon:yes gene_type:complete
MLLEAPPLVALQAEQILELADQQTFLELMLAQLTAVQAALAS